MYASSAVMVFRKKFLPPVAAACADPLRCASARLLDRRSARRFEVRRVRHPHLLRHALMMVCLYDWMATRTRISVPARIKLAKMRAAIASLPRQNARHTYFVPPPHPFGCEFHNPRTPSTKAVRLRRASHASAASRRGTNLRVRKRMECIVGRRAERCKRRVVAKPALVRRAVDPGPCASVPFRFSCDFLAATDRAPRFYVA